MREFVSSNNSSSKDSRNLGFQCECAEFNGSQHRLSREPRMRLQYLFDRLAGYQPLQYVFDCDPGTPNYRLAHHHAWIAFNQCAHVLTLPLPRPTSGPLYARHFNQPVARFSPQSQYSSGLTQGQFMTRSAAPTVDSTTRSRSLPIRH